MKKIRKNLLSMLFCMFMLTFLISAVSAAPSDLSIDQQQVVLGLPSQEAVTLSNEYNDLVKIDTGNAIPFLPPDWGTVQTFFYDPTLSFLNVGLHLTGSNKEKLSGYPDRYKNLVLPDFQYYDHNGDFVIANVTIGDILSLTDTTFQGYGISSSGYLEVRINTLYPHSQQDMVNIYNLIQKIASMNGYNTEIPVIFLEATIITDSGITSPDSSIVFISKGNAELRSKLDRQRPLWRGIYAENSPYSCTIGFAAKDGSGNYGVVTCGQGNSVGWRLYQPYASTENNFIGTVTSRSLSQVDASWIKCSSGVTSEGKIKGGCSFPFLEGIQPRLLKVGTGVVRLLEHKYQVRSCST